MEDCKSVFDVGCGNGSIVVYLDDGFKKLTGIDNDLSCICRAKSECK